jgi:hypothetical protein
VRPVFLSFARLLLNPGRSKGWANSFRSPDQRFQNVVEIIGAELVEGCAMNPTSRRFHPHQQLLTAAPRVVIICAPVLAIRAICNCDYADDDLASADDLWST